MKQQQITFLSLSISQNMPPLSLSKFIYLFLNSIRRVIPNLRNFETFFGFRLFVDFPKLGRRRRIRNSGFFVLAFQDTGGSFQRHFVSQVLISHKRLSTSVICSQKHKDTGREPWSSGNGRRLMFERSWVRIPAPFTWWTFFTFIWCTNCIVSLKKTENKRKRGRVILIFLKTNERQCWPMLMNVWGLSSIKFSRMRATSTLRVEAVSWTLPVGLIQLLNMRSGLEGICSLVKVSWLVARSE